VDEADERTPFLQHLEELRKRLIISICGVAVGFAAAYAGIAAAVADRAGHDAPPELTRSGREVSVATPALRDLARELGAGAARRRIVDVAELKAHFDAAAAASP